MDRRTDTDLKKIYSTVGAVCLLVKALTSISRALKVWFTNVEMALKSGVEMVRIITALEKRNLLAAFLAEASIDKLTSRLMIYLVMAKRALWLRYWVVDHTSKQVPSATTETQKETASHSFRPIRVQKSWGGQVV